MRLRAPADLAPERRERLRAFELRRGQTLPLFEALSNAPVAFDDLAAGTDAAINRTRLPVRLREVLILRTLARWGAQAEWDVHVLVYAPVAPLSAAEIAWLGGSPQLVAWSATERVLIDLADGLRRDATIPPNLWAAVEHLFDPAERAEILMVATQYVKVALLTNALALAPLVPGGPAIIDEGR